MNQADNAAMSAQNNPALNLGVIIITSCQCDVQHP